MKSSPESFYVCDVFDGFDLLFGGVGERVVMGRESGVGALIDG